MDLAERTVFLRGYLRLVNRYTTDDAFRSAAAADPAEALRSCGLEVPAGSQVVIFTDPRIEQSPETLHAAVSRWEHGEATGRFELPVPGGAVVRAAELTDDELRLVVGGLGAPGHFAWPGSSPTSS